MLDIANILKEESLSREDLIALLSVKRKEDRDLVFQKAASVRCNNVGNEIYLRGLIEYSNICEKNCFYCGIRAGNKQVERYCLDEDDVICSARHAFENDYGSIVIQSGERTDQDFINKIDSLVRKIKIISEHKLGITLSCGDQSKETYHRWFESGAHRYLLRFETSDPDLYYKIHPNNKKHFLLNRLTSLQYLKETGYQVGSGMMIGLPGQNIENLIDDLLMLKVLNVDMVGMGPYIEHKDTPLFKEKSQLLTKNERLGLSLLTIAVLRILIPDINIAAATALDSLSDDGRLQAIRAGANVLMPNITPLKYRENYFLYENKPYLTEADALIRKINESGSLNGYHIKLGEWGDSKHFAKRVKGFGLD
ncbi:MAG: [FeFe] hydrogenase H-cluster radical SAM maturase HydE [Bacteroidetes bacterium]|nr:[FeFe] hydrogenase H-cluster radical SAM maturase HydE [Bacteroidota bacterium]